MNSKTIALAVVLAIAAGQSNSKSQPDPHQCKDFRIRDEDYRPFIETIRLSGQYCLRRNIVQKKVSRGFGKGQVDFNGHAIFYPDVDSIWIDLNQHTITSDAYGHIAISGHRNGNDYFAPRFLKITDGTIEIKDNGKGIVIPRLGLIGSIWSDDVPRLRRLGKHLSHEPNNIIPEVARSLKTHQNKLPTLITIDDLTIRVGQTAINLTGNKNSIRNSRIEVTNGKAGIYLFGPNNIIENNIIIFRGTPQTHSAAPIKLHGGDGTIIRNNIIIVETSAPRHAITLIESKNVTISGNRIYGAAELVNYFESASSDQSGNNSMQGLDMQPKMTGDERRADQITTQ